MSEHARQELPDRIGKYSILALLGEGGMGTVYLAEQKEPVRRRVALKVIKLGMDSQHVLNRFELERQALAVMNHPAIAKVHDAGATDQGQPYFVMELVEGIPITDYCDDHRLTLKERIAIFQQVCRGVQHAHQKGVLHRDLKPGNILVARKDDQHVVKIIDFGLARATDHQLVAQTIFTEQGQLIGTPEYMSPEQAGGNALDIDTRTDIYSLGVVLYELFTGDQPFQSSALRAAGLLEMQRIIREQEPQKPSTRISSIGEAASGSANLRRVAPSSLTRQLRGDLDWIVLRAMAKEPERRYGSALNLAEDLNRYLAHDPVLAGPPSAWYRLTKLARKHRGQCTAAAVVFLVAVVGAIVAWTYAVTSDANLALFNRLKVVVQLEDAQAELSKLQPAWPGQIPAIEEWLAGFGQDLERALPEVRETLKQLQARAPQQTEEEKQADREAHPSHPALLAQKRRVDSLRKAMQTRLHGGQVAKATVPPDTPTDAMGINNDLAWPRVDPNRAAEAHGEEELGLALARRAVELATGDLHTYHDTLAWALFANGLDSEAREAGKAALDAATLRGKKSEFEVNLERLEQSIRNATDTLAQAEADLAELEVEVARRQTWSFPNEADRFLNKTLQGVERGLEAFLGEGGAKSIVERRLRWASQVESLTRAHPRAKATWASAREAIRNANGETASTLYSREHHPNHPIDLKPQMGLVPIGMNPITKLWEFYHLRSAFDPRTGQDPKAIEIPRHNDDGSIDVAVDTGIVFVLLPGGTYTMGAQNGDPSGKNFDRQAQIDEHVRDEVVAPFFLARCELTQAQWLRLSLGPNPSEYPAGVNAPPKPLTLQHPVEGVDWQMCADLMRLHGLVLPHEIQWEYACRAGKSTVWFPGDNPLDLLHHANLQDAYAKKLAPNWPDGFEEFNDGHLLHWPVGSHRANSFGLHDMHGNVWEWCSNLYAPQNKTPNRVYRGGSFAATSKVSRSSYRYGASPTLRFNSLGLRAARPLH